MNFYIELKQLTEHVGTPEYHMFQDIQDEENGFSNPAYNMTYWDYKNWLRQESLRANGENLPNDWVPYTTYVLYVNAEPVGYGRVRHCISKTLEANGCGPIGYAIAKEHRGKGYGTILLQELLKKCEQIGYSSIQLYPFEDNVASIKVMQKCGGTIVGTMQVKNMQWNAQEQRMNETSISPSKTIVHIDVTKDANYG